MISADKAVISASLTIVNYLPGILLIGGIAYVLDGLSVAFADGAILIKMVGLGAICTAVAGSVVPLDGLLLAVIGLSAFMVGRVLAGFTWIRKIDMGMNQKPLWVCFDLGAFSWKSYIL